MKSKLKIALIMLTVLSIALLGCKKKLDLDVVRVGTEGAYPPFNSYNESGELVGFDIDIAKALCEEMEVTCEFIAQDWDGIIPALLSGNYDVIIASMYITEERKEQVAFTDPYYKAGMTHVVPKNSDITELTDAILAGKKIGVQAATTQADYATATYPSADVRQYRTQDEVNLDLANGRLDLQVGDLFPMLDWIEKGEGKDCCKMIGESITDADFVGGGAGMALRKEDEALREALNDALKTIIKNGKYQEINDKYFSVNVL